MTDPYRSTDVVCPSCTSAAVPLREFQGRLVCDECGGMLLEVADFRDSLRETDGSVDELVVVEMNPVGRPCPRCQVDLAWCVVHYGKLELSGAFQACAKHGIWVARDAMTKVFALVARRVSGRGTRGGGAGGTSKILHYGNLAGGGMSGAMNSIASAFGSSAGSAGGLRVSSWASSRPRVHTLYVSAHKDKRLGCPTCQDTALAFAGDRWPCTTCEGTFVENAALEAMVQDLRTAPWEVPVVSGAPGERECPVCRAKMIVEVLEAVTIDRCGAHGVWFDEHELQDALQHVQSPEPSGVGGWIKKLFWRHGSTD